MESNFFDDVMDMANDEGVQFAKVPEMTLRRSIWLNGLKIGDRVGLVCCWAGTTVEKLKVIPTVVISIDTNSFDKLFLLKGDEIVIHANTNGLVPSWGDQGWIQEVD